MAWWNSGAKTDLANVSTLTSSVAADATNQDVASLQIDCQSLDDADITLEGDLPAPDGELQSDMQLFTAAVDASSKSCVAGDYANAATEIGYATQAAKDATARVNTITAQIDAGG
jgi:hypothetical protein